VDGEPCVPPPGECRPAAAKLLLLSPDAESWPRLLTWQPNQC
jgi:hypothetical protein